MNMFLLSQGFQSLATKSLLPSIFAPNSFSNPVCLQCVRWRKKPRWLPVARTKMYRIPTRVKHPVEEQVEVMRLFNNYRTAMKSIRLYLSEKTMSQTTAPEVIAEQLRLEQEEHNRCMALNDKWNEEVAKIRESRTAKQIENVRLNVLEDIAESQKHEEEDLKRIEELIRFEKERSKTFITSENIDEAIEKALSQTVDYNYCIDLKGNIYRGLRAKPGVTQPDKLDNSSSDSSKKQAVSQ